MGAGAVLCTFEHRGVTVEVVVADITRLKVEAIVNPANSLMIMGGGVAAAIKRAGGQEIEDEALKHAPVPVGKAVATSAGNLEAKYVIHAPTVERPAARTSANNVRKAVLAALEKAREVGVTSLAMPGMGTGVGGLGYDVAARVIAEALVDFLGARGEGLKLKKVVLTDIRPEFPESLCRALGESFHRRSAKG